MCATKDMGFVEDSRVLREDESADAYLSEWKSPVA
jgi:hypothetical protein